MEGRCLLCDSPTSGSANDDLQRLTPLLGLPVTAFSESHIKLCVGCDSKLGAVEMMLEELRVLYIESGKLYSPSLDVAEEEGGRPHQRPSPRSMGTQTDETKSQNTTGFPVAQELPEKKTRNSNVKSEIKGSTAKSPIAKSRMLKSRTVKLDLDIYTCPVCASGFGMRAAFRKHLKSHSATEFECQLCGQTFTRIFDLCTHYEACVQSTQVDTSKQAAAPIRTVLTQKDEGKDSSTIEAGGRRTATTRSMRSGRKLMDEDSDSVAVSAELPSDPQCDASEDSSQQTLEVVNEVVLADETLVRVDGMEVDTAEEAHDIHFELEQLGNEMDIVSVDKANSAISVSAVKRKRTKKPKSAQKENKPKSEYRCEICNREFGYLQSLQRHQTVHSEAKPYSCDKCDQKFKWAQSLKTHLVGHSEVLPYACQLCGKGFRGKGQLNQHLIMHSGAKVFSCTVCQAVFTRATRLKIHMRSHTGERPYQCEECGMGFADPQLFRKHQMNHRGEKPHVCNDCGKGFVMAKYLTEHRKLHTGERAYLCATCGAKFANSGRLKRHMEVHLKMKRHRCTFCPELFSYKESLRAHINCHMGLKPYTCAVCPKSFSHRAGLTQHKLVHNKHWNHACATCNNKFSTGAKLRRHARRHAKHANAPPGGEGDDNCIGSDNPLHEMQTTYLIEMGTMETQTMETQEVPVIGAVVETVDVTVEETQDLFKEETAAATVEETENMTMEETLQSSECLMEELSQTKQALQGGDDPQLTCSPNILQHAQIVHPMHLAPATSASPKHSQVVTVAGWKPNQSQAITIPVHVQNFLSTYTPGTTSTVGGHIVAHPTTPSEFVYRQTVDPANELQVAEGDLRHGVTIVKFEVPVGASAITLPTAQQ